MTLLEQITALVESEVERKLSERMNKYVEYVSKTYDISYPLLLRDLQKIATLDIPVASTSGRDTGTVHGQCMGFTKSGNRCKSSGKKYKGYCHHHKDSVPPPPPPQPKIYDSGQNEICEVQHNHTLPPLYSPDCPACKKLKHVPSKDKLLIEI